MAENIRIYIFTFEYNWITLLYTWNYHIIVNKLYFNLKKQTHRCREQTSGYQWGEGWVEGKYKGMGLRGTKYFV